LKELLHKFDEEGAYEFPCHCDIDYTDFEAKARIVDRRIQGHLSETTSFEDGLSNQDASFSLAIIFDERSSYTSIALYVPALRFSNFGLMTTITDESKFSKSERSAIRKILVEEGFSYIEPSDLDRVYDGIMSGSKGFDTWRTRYFDWI